MKIKLLLCTLVGTATLALAATDPVLMTIAGKKIHLSEFEYLYHKNSQQQVEQESLDQYLDRFVTYKLKVADAEAAQIDTSKTFQNEFNGYKNDLVKPFLEDTTVRDRLVQEGYQRMLTNVDIDHIMLPVGRDQAENDKQLARLDSIRNCVLNGEDFLELAKKYSSDPSVRRNNGHYGYIASNVFPYKWEYEAYNTPVGEMSKPFRTDFGNHLLRVNGTRPAPGQVEVEHILLLFPRNAPVTDEGKAALKVRIDSIYDALMAGADFEQMAKDKSEDRGTASKGGKLPWFGPNQMVPEFEKVSFELEDGAISKPFETNYGYHIVKKLGRRPVGSFEDNKKQIEMRIATDERSLMPTNAKIDEVCKLYNLKLDTKFQDYLKKELDKHGEFDSAFVADVLGKSNYTIYTFAGNKVPASTLAKKVNGKQKFTNEAAAGYIAGLVEKNARSEVFNYYRDHIIDDNADYRNLINEYRDGMLLFEISNRRIWEGASKDTVGLKNYFEANRSKYNWSSPHFRGIILSAKNDSVMQAVKEMIPTLGADTLTTTLHNKFGRDIKMERMLFGKGENRAVDQVVFGVTDNANPNDKYPVKMKLEGNMVDQPEVYTDVRGQVTSDYQDACEKAWLKELREKYPVKINQKVLKQVK